MVGNATGMEGSGVVTGNRDRVLLAVAAAAAAVPLLSGVALSISAVGQPGGLSATPLGEIGTVTFGLTTLALGVVLRSRRPDHPMGWLFVAFALAVGVGALIWAVMVVSRLPDGDARLGAAAAWVGAVFVAEAWVFLIVSIIVRFPSGRPATPFEARIVQSAAVFGVVVGILVGVRPGPLLVYPAFDNPLQVPASFHSLLLGLSSAALVAYLIPVALAALAIVRRYRAAGATERLQLRWFAYGASLLVVASVVYIAVGEVAAAGNPGVREVTYAIFAFAACGLPIAVFQAITSHRLYDIDRIISRTVAYGLLTAILAGLYTASLRLFNALFVAVTGEADEAALVLTTLVLATTFTPIKSRLEKMAARRFDPGSTAAGSANPLTPAQQAAVVAIAERIAARALDDRPRRGAPGNVVEPGPR